MKYQKRANFPKDCVIADNDPILQYLRWFWQKDDGWNALNTRADQGLKQHISRSERVPDYAPPPDCRPTEPAESAAASGDLRSHASARSGDQRRARARARVRQAHLERNIEIRSIDRRRSQTLVDSAL